MPEARLTGLLSQICKFGIVGLLATGVNAVIYLVAVAGKVPPLLANAAGFGCAFAISYAGHSLWTFAGAGPAPRAAFFKFVATALAGFANNSFFTWLLTAVLRLPPQSALIAILLITPTLVFTMSKHWVFVGPERT